MIISGTRFDLELKANSHYKTDACLIEILNDTRHYLDRLEHSGLRWLGLKRKNYHRYSRSWMRVNLDLGNFLVEPKSQYTRFMNMLDSECDKFPTHCVYVNHLKNLRKFISQGPVFSDEIKKSIFKY